MAESEFIGGRSPNKQLTWLDAARVLDDAWRLVSIWETRDTERGEGAVWTPAYFAEELTVAFEHLLAHHAEANGYGFLRPGIGDGLAQQVRELCPPGSRAGWRWSGAIPSKLPKG